MEEVKETQVGNFQPKYATMKDLGFNNYEPIYPRDHLTNDVSAYKIFLTQEEKKLFQNITKAIYFFKSLPILLLCLLFISGCLFYFQQLLPSITLLITTLFLGCFCYKHLFTKPVIVRCAGGWVRDKLLQCNSDDIDLAIDTMTGRQFAEMLQKYFQIKQLTPNACIFTVHMALIYKNTIGYAILISLIATILYIIVNQKQNIYKMSSFAIIAQNPEKSKHLETVTFKIGNIEVDAVNLRKEIYTKDSSRVPEMTFATAKEDALRRDLTINALFYNINDGKVEDFTAQGLKDLITGIARTPLNAMITFEEDSLRILRNVRHAVTKFGFELHNDIIIAAQHPKIHKILKTQISRERMGVEFEKMLRGHYVWIAMQCLVQFGLAQILFEFPKDEQIVVFESSLNLFDKDRRWEYSIELTKITTQIVLTDINKCDVYNVCEDKIYGKQIQKELLFAAFTYPFHGIKFIETNKKKRKVESALVMYFVQYSLKGMIGGKKLGEMVYGCYHCGVDMVIDILTEENEKEKALEVGKFLRLCGDKWIYVMYLVKAVCRVYEKGISVKQIDELEWWIKNESGLIKCWEWKPLINGNELLEKYKDNGLKRDFRVAKLMKYILHLRLANPNIMLDEVDKLIVAWLEQNPAPQSKKSKKKKAKKKKKKTTTTLNSKTPKYKKTIKKHKTLSLVISLKLTNLNNI
eukprot:117307_1